MRLLLKFLVYSSSFLEKNKEKDARRSERGKIQRVRATEYVIATPAQGRLAMTNKKCKTSLWYRGRFSVPEKVVQRTVPYTTLNYILIKYRM
jgi:hypothetical protein